MLRSCGLVVNELELWLVGHKVVWKVCNLQSNLAPRPISVRISWHTPSSMPHLCPSLSRFDIEEVSCMMLSERKWTTFMEYYLPPYLVARKTSKDIHLIIRLRWSEATSFSGMTPRANERPSNCGDGKAKRQIHQGYRPCDPQHGWVRGIQMISSN